MIGRVAEQAGLALLVGLGFAWMAVGTGAQQVGRAPLEVRVPAPPGPVVALGRAHLAWEVHITNFATRPLQLARVEALDVAGAVLGSWSDAPLRQRVAVVGRPGTGADTNVSLAPGARAVAFLWVTLDAGHPAPAALVHRVTTRSDDGSPEVVTTTSPVALTGAGVVQVEAPVHGGRWVAVRGPSPGSGHRLSLVALDGAVRVPQRFAVDWVRLGDDGRPFRGEGAAVADWFGYDTTVVAVADGAVALVRDGMADATPRTAPPATIDAKDAPGNIVVLDIGGGRFATYAHLKTGSILVKDGARVRAGQVLARIGNSGNSLGPHLHFQISDAAEPLGGEGLPFSLDRFELAGRIPGLASLLAGTPWRPQADQPARQVRAETPLENMVVTFHE